MDIDFLDLTPVSTSQRAVIPTPPPTRRGAYRPRMRLVPLFLPHESGGGYEFSPEYWGLYFHSQGEINAPDGVVVLNGEDTFFGY